MSVLLALSLFSAFARPEMTPVGIRDLQLARELESRPVGRLAVPLLDWREAVPGRFVIGYQEGREGDAVAQVKNQGGRVRSGSVTGDNFVVAEFPVRDRVAGEELIRSLAQSPFVRYAEPQIRCRALFTPSDPYYSLHQWGNWVMYSDLAWDRSTGSRDVKVGIVDEGIDYTHPDLVECFDPGTRGYDFVDGDADPRPVNGNEMHGSHVAGIVAAGNNNAVGVAGWANVTLYSCRALNDSGSGSTTDIADGIRWATDHGVRVINMSLGATSSSSVLQDAVVYAWNHGVLVVAASGNDAMRGVYFPAAYDQCIAVGAFDSTGSLADFSNYGPEQEVTAPGVGILSTTPGSQYYYMDGTSMASPEVAGVAALLFSYRPGLSNRQVRAILDASAIDQGSAGRDEYYGYGLVNAFRALSLAQLYGADLEPARALSAPSDFPTVIRSSDLRRVLPDNSILLDAQGRVHSSVSGHGVYFIRPAADKSGAAVKVTVVE